MSKVHSFRHVQFIPAGLPVLWQFFSDARNLNQITPAHLQFRILSDITDDPVYAGQLIEYTVRPLLHIPMYWMTEITQVQQLQFFIDEQRFGPYRFWHHQHHFKEVPGGVEMTDIVHYKLPLGWLGSIANALFVKKQLAGIFSYRRQKIEELFGAGPATHINHP